jgi:hypothetical protein
VDAYWGDARDSSADSVDGVLETVGGILDGGGQDVVVRVIVQGSLGLLGDLAGRVQVDGVIVEAAANGRECLYSLRSRRRHGC